MKRFFVVVFFVVSLVISLAHQAVAQEVKLPVLEGVDMGGNEEESALDEFFLVESPTAKRLDQSGVWGKTIPNSFAFCIMCIFVFTIMHFVKQVCPFYILAELGSELFLLSSAIAWTLAFGYNYHYPEGSASFYFFSLLTSAGVARTLYMFFILPLLP